MIQCLTQDFGNTQGILIIFLNMHFGYPYGFQRLRAVINNGHA